MSTKLKPGTNTGFPVTIDDDDFDGIEAIEFVFTQTEKGETIKSAYYSRDGQCRDCYLVEGTHNIVIVFSREDTYKFKQNAPFFMDTRIHREGTSINPVTPVITLTMNRTLFKEGEEVGS